MTQGERTHKQRPRTAILAPSRRGNIACGKVFVRMISAPRHDLRGCRHIGRRGHRLRGVGRERALVGFRQAIEAAIPALRRYARALTRHGELADDHVHDNLVRELRSDHLFHGGDIRSWLYTILTNLNRNRLRSLSRRPGLASIEGEEPPSAASSEAGGRAIERAPASTVDDQGVALLFRVLEGLIYREVA